MSLLQLKEAITAAVGSVAATLGLVAVKSALVVPAALLGVGGFAVLGAVAVVLLAAVFADEERRKSARKVIRAVFGWKKR